MKTLTFFLRLLVIFAFTWTAPAHPARAQVDPGPTVPGVWECYDRESLFPCQEAYLFDVDTVAVDDAWAVGAGGAILHWDGGKWSRVLSPITQQLNAVAMTSKTDGWAAGEGGALLHWDGAHWSGFPTPVYKTLEAIEMVSAADGWAGGWENTLLHWNGREWSIFPVPAPSRKPVFTQDPAPGPQTVRAISMVSSDYGWAVTDDGRFLHWDGKSWAVIPSQAYGGLYDIDMISSRDGWAVGGRHILRWDGKAWKIFSTSALYLISISMASPSYGWAIGGYTSPTRMLRWDGSSWREVGEPVGAPLDTLDLYSAEDGRAVGYEGALVHWDGNHWSIFSQEGRYDLSSIVMASETEGWAVGWSNTILRWDGQTWSDFPITDYVHMTDLALVSPDDVWAVGDGILHWGGSAWSRVPSPTVDSLNDIAMLSADNGWAVGSRGTILHWDGVGWTVYPNPTGSELRAVDFVSPDDGWAVSGYPSSAMFMHWDGKGWKGIQGLLLYPLWDVKMLSPTDGWAVGEQGTILHWDGSEWVQVPSPTSEALTALAILSEEEAWAVGGSNTILHYRIPPSLSMEHPVALPGSFLTIQGSHFPKGSSIILSANGRALGAVSVDSSGSFTAILDTRLADPGSYNVTTDAGSPSIKFHLDPHAPLWPQDGGGPIFELPAGIANQDLYLPLIILRAAFG